MSKYNSTDVHCLATSWTLVITQSSGNRQAAIGSPQASQFSSNHKAFGRQSSDVQAIQMSYDTLESGINIALCLLFF